MTKQKMTIELPDGVFGIQSSGFATDADYLKIDTPEAADELIERVKAAKEKAKRPAGMPEEGQRVFLLKSDGTIDPLVWSRFIVWHLDSFECGNIFLTIADAEKECDRRKALQRVRVWIAENTEPFEPKLGTVKERWAIGYEEDTSRFRDVLCKYEWPISALWLATKADTKRLIAACESDLRTLAGVE